MRYWIEYIENIVIVEILGKLYDRPVIPRREGPP